MKVIKLGRPQKGWSTEILCTGGGNGGGGCGAQLLVEQNDMYTTYRGYMDGSSDTFVTFTCCECGVETDIPKVPRNIIDLLPSKKARFDL